MTDRIRLFVATSVPREHLERLAGAIAPLVEALPEARWAPLDNQHVTLKFLGGVDAGRVPDILTAIAAAAVPHAPAELSIGDLGTFPSPKRARVLWAGLEDPAGLLTSLAAGLDEHLGNLGFEAEKRGFTPHLTLARFKVPARIGPELLSAPVRSDLSFTVDSVELYRSHMSPKGARYEVLEEVRL